MMANSINSAIEYFFKEGKENLEECLRIAFETAVLRNVRTLVIFTGVGEGPKLAIEKYRSQSTYADIKIIAVTFPYGQRFSTTDDPVGLEISREDRRLFAENNIPIIRAHLPFNPIAAHHKSHGVLGQDLTLIGNALSIFCGSMSLCVQAALMACDAGEVELGEHVISLTSDTAILVRSAPTERLLTDFIIREILCKPMSLTVVKREKGLSNPPSQLTLDAVLEKPEMLPSPNKSSSDEC
jgi:hypothetical protein